MELLKEIGESHQAEPTKKIIVNDQEITPEKFQEMNTDPKIKLVQLQENTFKVLNRMLG
jgi:hypothetical protein